MSKIFNIEIESKATCLVAIEADSLEEAKEIASSLVENGELDLEYHEVFRWNDLKS